MIQYSFEHKKFDFLASRTMIMKSQHFKVRICVLHSYHGRPLLFLFSIHHLECYFICWRPIRVVMIKQMIWKNCVALTLVASTVRDKMTSLCLLYIVYYLSWLLQNKTCKTGKINSNEKQIFTNFWPLVTGIFMTSKI